MSRPNARRRPTNLRIESHEQGHALTATIATSLCLAASYACWHHTSTSLKEASTGDVVFVAGMVLLVSWLQREFLPLQYTKIKDAEKRSTVSVSSSLIGSLLQAVSILASFVAVLNVGPVIVTALLLPLPAIRRVQQLGFLARPTTAVLLLAVSWSCLVASSIYTGESLYAALIGYTAIASVCGAEFLATRYEPSTGTSVVAGLALITAPILGATTGILKVSGSILTLLTTALAIGARVWQPLSPKAINFSFRIGWPIAIVTLLVIYEKPAFLCLAAIFLIYIALFLLLPNAATATSATATIANTIPSAQARATAWGGYYIGEIIKEKESRDIFYFLLLNLSFMFVQMMYGIWTNSLGLISDSIHMLFDCLALAVGLIAAVMSKWPASRAHPFGFAKVEIISGFANSIFLVLISFSIVMEALERLMEPPEMKTDQLLLVSTIGLLVNLVGLFCFGHAHHGHSHSHGHSHGHSHAHGNENSIKDLPSHTPKLDRDSAYDFAMGLPASPLQEKHDFRQGRPGALSELHQNVQPFPVLSPSGAYKGRSASPIRRPGSPLKQSSVLEETPHEQNHAHVTAPQIHHDNHDHALSDGLTSKHSLNSSHKHDHDHDHGHNHTHNHKHDDHQHHHRGHNHKDDDYHHHDQGHNHKNDDHHHHDQGHHHKNDDQHHGHGHAHHGGSCGGHGHSHNLEGIFLHVLADTLGSAGVIVSTILIRYFGWTGFDPLASIFIAVLIFLSVVPLLRTSFADLMVMIESDQEYAIREALGEASLVTGVGAMPFIRFWNDGDRHLHGIVTITAGIDGDLDAVRVKVRRKLQDGIKGLSSLVVQVDRGS